jgi:serine phosphatase RsbU (regulator of sigma subunit)
VVGELSLFSPGGQHTASVRAYTRLQVLEMTRTDFDALLHRHPSLAYAMVQTLGVRLIEAESGTIRDLRQKNQQLALAYQELAAAQAQVIEKEKLEKELDVARRIQSSLLPRTLPRRDGFDFGALMAPMSAVGGDFFDFVALGDDLIGIAVGDVSDHGVPAALFMAITVTLLRAEARRGVSPGAVLQSVGRQLLDVNDAEMFVTVLYGVLDCARREFTYARAGHEPPLLFDAQGEPVSVNRQRGQLLGIAPDPAVDEQQIALPPGGTLLLYTDGAREAGGPGGALFGAAGLHKAVRGPRLPAQALCERLLTQVAAYRGPTPQQDDITLIAVQLT